MSSLLLTVQKKRTFQKIAHSDKVTIDIIVDIHHVDRKEGENIVSFLSIKDLSGYMPQAILCESQFTQYTIKVKAVIFFCQVLIL